MFILLAAVACVFLAGMSGGVQCTGKLGFDLKHSAACLLCVCVWVCVCAISYRVEQHHSASHLPTSDGLP